MLDLIESRKTYMDTQGGREVQSYAHHAHYMRIANAVGLNRYFGLRGCVLAIAHPSKIAECYAEDRHLNKIPLQRWDSFDLLVRAHVKSAISDGRIARSGNGTFSWSLSDTVCLLKAVAVDYVTGC